jgi:uncharacterized protein (TIGR03085 family)
MSSRPLDAIERDELCDLFLELGPDEPTLCEGWSTLDLATHLVLRERDPRSGLWILGGDRFAKLEARLSARAKQQGLEKLVARLRKGPPPVPWRVPGLRTAMNLNEWFVHHEDVRRANGRSPRSDIDELQDALWGQLQRAGKLMTRGLKGTGLVVDAPERGRKELRKGDPSVTLAGDPGELVLYLNGRRAAAQVQLDGPTPAITTLTEARLGI